MSYHLAVWEGPRPIDDNAAQAAFARLRTEYPGGRRRIRASTLIQQYISQLLARWPDLDSDAEDDEDDIPWSDGPLIDNASGPLFYFGVVYSKYEEATEFAVERAQALGLICFDPQTGRLAP
ncbi:hypothetical protein ED92_17770 [Amycolatopsis sp. MJM2582]|uniref:hypothetical protein n=1 Tax=unclassified Amycolatopsis TaxID=2618356 RepID=UPI000504E3D2|nr:MULTISPECIES: hypothetical protein [unclassified Amycolatopsis]KFZ82064.1 hypothetical protein ED92_17770 [Amycolatopsis sp. MJM2582]RSN41967.1 hypothetical protein DMC64_28150 [Amycolatopsis sp. WAC 04197]